MHFAEPENFGELEVGLEIVNGAHKRFTVTIPAIIFDRLSALSIDIHPGFS